MSIQLHELINRNGEGADAQSPIANQPNAEHNNESASNYIPGTLLTPGSSTTEVEVNASFNSTESLFKFSKRSMSRSMSSLHLPSFTEDLQKSRVYKRARDFCRGGGSSSHSVISSDTSSVKGDTCSMLSMGELSISEISELYIPVCWSDLHDPTPFQQTSATTSKQGQGSLKSKWFSRGSLHSALRANDPFRSKALIALGFSRNWVDSNGDTPLLCLMKDEGIHRGFDNQAMHMLKCLLHNDRAPRLLQYIPIIEFMWELSEARVDVNLTDAIGRTALSYAAEAGWLMVCILLLEKGANVDSTDSTRRTPLMYAFEAGKRNTCDLLLEKGANVNSTNAIHRTPLFYAAEAGWLDMCKLLLEKGANVDSTDSTGRTPLSYATGTGSRDTCKVLLDEGASVHSTDLTGRTPLSYATEAGWLDVCMILLEKGANVNSTDATGRTPLFYAGEAGMWYVCVLLLEKGANVNSTDSTGRTPLSYATAAGHKDVCNLLEKQETRSY